MPGGKNRFTLVSQGLRQVNRTDSSHSPLTAAGLGWLIEHVGVLTDE